MYKPTIMQCNWILFICLLCSASAGAQQTSFKDTSFMQEYHQAYPISNDVKEKEVRSITTDKEGNVWIATAAGILVKNKNRD